MRQWCGIASGNGVLLFGAAPLPGPTLTYQDIPREIQQNTLLTPQLRTPNGAGNASQQLTSVWLVYNIYIYIYIYLLLLISMLWHRQAIFISKGDKLCSSAECRIWTRGPRHQIASRLNARWQTDWAIEDQAKNLNSTARPYDQHIYIYNIDMDILFKVNTRNTHFRLLKSCSWNMIKKNYSPPLRTYKLT